MIHDLLLPKTNDAHCITLGWCSQDQLEAHLHPPLILYTDRLPSPAPPLALLYSGQAAVPATSKTAYHHNPLTLYRRTVVRPPATHLRQMLLMFQR
jgi:hypothetical protein